MTTLMIVFFVVIPVAIGLFAARCYRKCPADKVLVVYGYSAGKGLQTYCIHGGGAFVMPVLQDFAYLDLRPRKGSFALDRIMTKEGSYGAKVGYTVQIASGEPVVENAAECLLNQSDEDIMNMADNIVAGEVRWLIANSSLSDISAVDEIFVERMRCRISPKLEKIGLELSDFSISEVTKQIEN